MVYKDHSTLHALCDAAAMVEILSKDGRAQTEGYRICHFDCFAFCFDHVERRNRLKSS